ncbi:hypothetical protein IGI42_002635 [Enterococcus sp. AZ109]
MNGLLTFIAGSMFGGTVAVALMSLLMSGKIDDQLNKRE